MSLTRAGQSLTAANEILEERRKLLEKMEAEIASAVKQISADLEASRAAERKLQQEIQQVVAPNTALVLAKMLEAVQIMIAAQDEAVADIKDTKSPLVAQGLQSVEGAMAAVQQGVEQKNAVDAAHEPQQAYHLANTATTEVKQIVSEIIKKAQQKFSNNQNLAAQPEPEAPEGVPESIAVACVYAETGKRITIALTEAVRRYADIITVYSKDKAGYSKELSLTMEGIEQRTEDLVKEANTLMTGAVEAAKGAQTAAEEYLEAKTQEKQNEIMQQIVQQLIFSRNTVTRVLEIIPKITLKPDGLYPRAAKLAAKRISEVPRSQSQWAANIKAEAMQALAVAQAADILVAYNLHVGVAFVEKYAMKEVEAAKERIQFAVNQITECRLSATAKTPQLQELDIEKQADIKQWVDRIEECANEAAACQEKVFAQLEKIAAQKNARQEENWVEDAKKLEILIDAAQAAREASNQALELVSNAEKFLKYKKIQIELADPIDEAERAAVQARSSAVDMAKIREQLLEMAANIQYEATNPEIPDGWNIVEPDIVRMRNMAKSIMKEEQPKAEKVEELAQDAIKISKSMWDDSISEEELAAQVMHVKHAARDAKQMVEQIEAQLRRDQDTVRQFEQGGTQKYIAYNKGIAVQNTPKKDASPDEQFIEAKLNKLRSIAQNALKEAKLARGAVGQLSQVQQAIMAEQAVREGAEIGAAVVADMVSVAQIIAETREEIAQEMLALSVSAKRALVAVRGGATDVAAQRKAAEQAFEQAERIEEEAETTVKERIKETKETAKASGDNDVAEASAYFETLARAVIAHFTLIQLCWPYIEYQCQHLQAVIRNQTIKPNLSKDELKKLKDLKELQKVQQRILQEITPLSNTIQTLMASLKNTTQALMTSLPNTMIEGDAEASTITDQETIKQDLALRIGEMENLKNSTIEIANKMCKAAYDVTGGPSTKEILDSPDYHQTEETAKLLTLTEQFEAAVLPARTVSVRANHAAVDAEQRYHEQNQDQEVTVTTTSSIALSHATASMPSDGDIKPSQSQSKTESLKPKPQPSSSRQEDIPAASESQQPGKAKVAPALSKKSKEAEVVAPELKKPEAETKQIDKAPPKSLSHFQKHGKKYISVLAGVLMGALVFVLLFTLSPLALVAIMSLAVGTGLVSSVATALAYDPIKNFRSKGKTGKEDASAVNTSSAQVLKMVGKDSRVASHVHVAETNGAKAASSYRSKAAASMATPSAAAKDTAAPSPFLRASPLSS